MGLCLLHFADTHIGVETYGRIDPVTGRHSRLTDFQRALDRAVEIALEAEVHAALFAGDAYRTCHPNPTHQQAFAASIERLVAAGVPVVMVAGNHDIPVAHGRATALDIFRTLVGDRVKVVIRPELVRIETAGGPLQVACLPWPTRSLLRARDEAGRLDDSQLRERIEQLCRDAIETMAAELDPAHPAVLLAHITAADAVFSGSERVALSGVDPTLSRGALADPRFDYVALGHIHRHQDVNPGARPAVVYPGSIERIDFGEAADAKGVCLVTIGDGPKPAERDTSWRFAELPTRAFVQLRVTIPNTADPTAHLLEQLGAYDLSDAVVRVYYRCSDEQYEQLDLRAVRQACGAAHLVAGLIREREAPERRPEVEITEHHDVLDALGRYLDTRPELAPLREAILAAGRELTATLEGAEQSGEEETP